MLKRTKGGTLKNVAIALGLICSLVAAGPPQDGQAPEDTRYPDRARCAMNLIELSARLGAFAAAHGGALPSKLSEALTGTDPERWRCLICPGARPAVVRGGFHPSYVYLNITPGGRKLETGAEDIVAFDSGPVHQDGRNVLLSTMDVVYLSEAEFQTKLAAERQKWERAGKKVEFVRQDFIPLDDAQAEAMREDSAARPSGGWRALTGSVHFKIAVVLVIAIGVVAVLLALQARKRNET
ncbi:MAG: hypothetical protein ABIF82_09245 [Planctomycetota bacterium]